MKSRIGVLCLAFVLGMTSLVGCGSTETSDETSKKDTESTEIESTVEVEDKTSKTDDEVEKENVELAEGLKDSLLGDDTDDGKILQDFDWDAWGGNGSTGSSDTDDSTDETDENGFHATSSSETSNSDTKRVGEDGYGFLTVPSTWVEFHEADPPEGVKLIQYSDITGTDVITMSVLDNTNTTKEYADSTMYYMSQDSSVMALEGAQVKIDGCDSYQVYCYYTDVNKWFCVWIFEGTDGQIHRLSIEDRDGEQLIELGETYSLRK